jgi:predicted HTH domain antitoxin
MSVLTKDTLLERELAAVVRAGMFPSEKEALAEVLGTFFTVKPQYRLEAAMEMFKSREVSLEGAAQRASMNRWRFQGLLMQRGIKIEVEVDDAEVRAQSARVRSKYL